jgi:VWFA-related protein
MTAIRPRPISVLTALLLALSLALGPGRLAVAADPLLVVNQVLVDRFPEVAVYFTAVDSAGLPIVDIGKDRVQVIHNGRPVPALSLDLADAQQDGLAIVVAIDTSGSMQGEPLEHARSAVRVLLDRMEPRDRGALVSFGQTVQVVQDLTDNRDALHQAVDGLVARGDTALYDGTAQAIALAAGQPLGRRAVVVITDGEDTHSRQSLDDVIGKARETTTPVSVIGFGEMKPEPMQQLAASTGGSFSEAPDPDRLAERATQTSELLRKQYVLRYRAPDSRPPENELELVVSGGRSESRVSQRFPAPPMPPLTVSLADLAPGSTVRGQVALRPALPDGASLDRVEYLLDDAPLQTVADAPYAFTWDTTTAPPGQHILTVRAHLGEQEAQQQVPVTVAPAAQLTIKPPAGSEISGRVTLLAELAPAAPEAGVVWAVDGQPIGTSTRPPYEIEWDSAAVPPGEHTVTAEAQDAQGIVGRASQTVRVLPFVPGAGPAAGGTVVPGSPVAGSPAAVAPGTTATPVPTRTPTSTPTGSRVSEALDRVSPAAVIGLVVVAAVVVGGLIYAASRRKAAAPTGREPTARLPFPEDRVLGQGQRGLPPPVVHDVREAQTEMISLHPEATTAQAGAPGTPTLIVTVAGEPPRSWPLGVDQLVGRAGGPSSRSRTRGCRAATPGSPGKTAVSCTAILDR